MIKKVIFTLLLSLSWLINAQQIELDKYQYIIVPNQFEFVNSVDAYQTSSLTKFLLQKNGFPVFLSNETVPNSLSENKCAALIVSIKDDSSMLQTKSYFEAKDCFGKIIYTSKIGKSKFKDYKKAYHASIRQAHKTMTDFKYSYIDTESLKSKDKDVVAMNISNDVYREVLKQDKIAKEVKKQKVVKENLKEDIKEQNTSILYAQQLPNGFQLVNAKPEIVFTLLKTTKSNLYLLKNLKGIVFEKDNKWFVEYYKGSKLIQQEIQIKF